MKAGLFFCAKQEAGGAMGRLKCSCPSPAPPTLDPCPFLNLGQVRGLIPYPLRRPIRMSV